MRRRIYASAEVDFDDLDSEDLVEELRSRGYSVKKLSAPKAQADQLSDDEAEAELAYRALRRTVPNADRIIEDFILSKAGRIQ